MIVYRQQYMLAQNALNVEGCLSYWSDDCVLLPPNEPAVIGKEALRSWYRNAFDDQFKSENTITFDEIEIMDGWSFARGSYIGALIPKAGGEPIQVNGKYLEIHQQQPDGSWKFARHMWSSDNPATDVLE